MVSPSRSQTRSRIPQTVAKQVRQRSVRDVAISTFLLVLALGALLVGAVFDVLVIGLSGAHDASNPGVGALVAWGAGLALLGLVGAAITVFAIQRRRRGWPFALATFLVIVLGWITIFFLFAAAVGVG